MVELYKHKLDWNFFKSISPLSLSVFAYAHCKLQVVCMVYSEAIDNQKVHELGYGWGWCRRVNHTYKSPAQRSSWLICSEDCLGVGTQ